MFKWIFRILVLSVVIYFIPMGEEHTGLTEKDKVSTMDALGAFSTTYGDLSNFCSRNEEVCLLSTKFFRVVAYKVKAGVQMVIGNIDNDQQLNEKTSKLSHKPDQANRTHQINQATQTNQTEQTEQTDPISLTPDDIPQPRIKEKLIQG